MVWIAKSEAESAAIPEIINLPPRAAAVVAGAFLHDRIKYMVMERFPVEGSIKDNLFRETGPLGSFDVLTKLAYTLGLFSKLAFQDSRAVGDIRNRFAHRLAVRDFDHDDVAPMCKDLKLIERHLFPQGTPDEAIPSGINRRVYVEDLPAVLADNRKRFQFTVMLLTSSLTPLNVVGEGRPRVPRAPI